MSKETIGHIGILFRVEVKPAKRQAFIEFIEWDVRVAKEHEPGTLRFDLYQDPKDENAFFVYEAYRDKKAFEEHKKSEPLSELYLARYAEMLNGFHKLFDEVEAVCSLMT
jgi:autoinducer 2-degrading protein